MNSVPDLDSIAVAAVRDVLGIGFRLHLVAESLDEMRESPSDAIWLTSSVNLVGTQTGGIVYLEVSESLLDSLNQAMGGRSPDPFVRESEMADLAGELANMIAGRIASGLAAFANSSVPSTVHRPLSARLPVPGVRWGCQPSVPMPGAVMKSATAPALHWPGWRVRPSIC